MSDRLRWRYGVMVLIPGVLGIALLGTAACGYDAREADSNPAEPSISQEEEEEVDAVEQASVGDVSLADPSQGVADPWGRSVGTGGIGDPHGLDGVAGTRDDDYGYEGTFTGGEFQVAGGDINSYVRRITGWDKGRAHDAIEECKKCGLLGPKDNVKAKPNGDMFFGGKFLGNIRDFDPGS